MLEMFAEKIRTHEEQYREQDTVRAMRAPSPLLEVWLLDLSVKQV